MSNRNAVGFEWHLGESSYPYSAGAPSPSEYPSTGQPQLGQPQLGQPQLGQPQLGQPQSGQFQRNQFQRGQPNLTQPALRYGTGIAFPQSDSASAEWRLLMSLLRAVLLFVAGLTIVQAGSASPRQLELAAIQGEIETVINLEMSAWRRNDKDAFRLLIDASVSDNWLDYWDRHWSTEPEHRFEKAPTILDLSMTEIATEQGEQRKDLAIVTLADVRTAHTRFSVTPALETRFYRRAGSTWVRTIPPSIYWGDIQTLETDYLRLVFTNRDAKDVTALAEEMDAVYLQLHQILNVPLTYGATERLTLSILPEAPSSTFVPGATQYLSSPSVLALAIGEDDMIQDAPVQEVLVQDAQTYLRFALTNRIIDVALYKTRFGLEHTYWTRWDSVIWGARGWLANHVLHEETVWDQQAWQAFSNAQDEGHPATVGELGYYRGEREYLLWQYMASKTLFDYIDTEFGRDRLVAVLRGFNGYRSWAGLLKDVLGVTITDFEAGWNRYLADLETLSEYSERGQE